MIPYYKPLRILLSRGHGTAHRRLHIQPKQQQQQQLQHYSQQQHYRGAKTLYSNGRHNPHEVSPSSFRYYSSSVEYLAGITCPLKK